MENRIPLPTDNIFKFYALFGLLLFVFGIGALLYTTKTSNTYLTEALVELEALKTLQSPSPPQSMRKAAVERLIEIEISNKATFKWGIALIVTVGFGMMLYGFWVWHKVVQPLQDAMVKLQFRKLEIEVERLESERTCKNDQCSSA